MPAASPPSSQPALAPHHSAKHASASLACDIFCVVIDNFGDIGVCWRLARQLSTEHGWQVRVLVDDLHAFQALCPALVPSVARQTIDGIVIEHWHEPTHAGAVLKIADVVLEAFGCDLPPVYLAAMARRIRQPVWLNLEYLSAEDWVAEFHLRPSPHPRYPLVKTFFFPGLSAGTGGVLKEHDLDARRHAFSTSVAARAAWWLKATGEPPPAPEATVISLFAYENPAIGSLLEQWRDGHEAIILLVPEGRISGALADFFGLASFAAGTQARQGNLHAHALVFSSQQDYDALLWISDVNFVRGEDSFARAQWAQKPFIWHIYPQADAAHLPKLDAALTRYAAHMEPAAHAALVAFWHAWNGAGTPDWAHFRHHLPAFHTQAGRWAETLAEVGDLAGNLADFIKTQLK
ncbi:elongation factor P maturation arginine rhamnosyltransferase EarP [Paraburkholderia bonniea]|uniref:elongation factor P maturation arginine rhamnosyltransferase EarP n=1 Tax=Paraburkholderia bonniea TaxID=2152891 RepID=UPI001290EFCD|nr:elongation factor P maturation arginine rhamnosyltransferase EarP [Paraburkholderia bonniea]